MTFLISNQYQHLYGLHLNLAYINRMPKPHILAQGSNQHSNYTPGLPFQLDSSTHTIRNEVVLSPVGHRTNSLFVAGVLPRFQFLFLWLLSCYVCPVEVFGLSQRLWCVSLRGGGSLFWDKFTPLLSCLCFMVTVA